jgi:hypothetical protein
MLPGLQFSQLGTAGICAVSEGGMKMRKEYKMTMDDMNTLLNACKPVPYMVFNGQPPRSPQEYANAAWEALGNKLGFVWDSAQPIHGKSDLYFTAEPLPLCKFGQGSYETEIKG